MPQFDETATIIVAPALATAHNKRFNIRLANQTDFPQKEEHTPILLRKLKEIRELIKKEELDPKKDQESRKKFLDMFQWKESQNEGDDRKQLEQTIIEYNDIFARHRLDIGINNSFKVKLTPKDECPIYTQSLPIPLNLKEDLTLELD